MIHARIILNHIDNPEVVLFESGQYERPICIVEAYEIKQWAREIDKKVRELKGLRYARAKRKSRP